MVRDIHAIGGPGGSIQYSGNTQFGKIIIGISKTGKAGIRGNHSHGPGGGVTFGTVTGGPGVLIGGIGIGGIGTGARGMIGSGIFLFIGSSTVRGILGASGGQVRSHCMQSSKYFVMSCLRPSCLCSISL